MPFDIFLVFPSPHACQDVERHQSSFQIFKTWAWGKTLSLTIWKEINCVKCLPLQPSLKIGMSDTPERVDPSCRFPMKGRKEHFRPAALENTETGRAPLHRLVSKLKGNRQCWQNDHIFCECVQFPLSSQQMPSTWSYSRYFTKQELDVLTVTPKQF